MSANISSENQEVFEVRCSRVRTVWRRGSVKVQAATLKEAEKLANVLWEEAYRRDDGAFFRDFGGSWKSSDVDESISVGEKGSCLKDLEDLPESAVRVLVEKMEGRDLDLSGVKTISEGALRLLATHKGKVVLPAAFEATLESFRVLTVEVAERFIADKKTDLARFTTITDEAADVLSGATLNLCLDGLKVLPANAARLLTKKAKYSSLSLRGLTSLSPDTAEALGKTRADLDLSGLTSLPDDIAVLLGRSRGGLVLDGLVFLSSEKAALAVARRDHSRLSLNGLTYLEVGVAEAISRGGKKLGFLSLNGLTYLEVGVAKAIGRSGKDLEELSLNGLKSLSEKQASALFRKWVGCVGLNGLTSLSLSVAVQMRGRIGILGLNGLTDISAFVAECLSDDVGDLQLDGLRALSEPVAKALGNGGYSSTLSLGGLRSLHPVIAQALAKFPGTIALHGVTWVGEDTAAALSQGNFTEVSFGELSELSVKAAEILLRMGARVPGVDWQKAVCPAVLTKGIAERFVRGEGLELHLFTEIQEAAAKVLAGAKGPLDLHWLSEIGGGTALALARHEGDLDLSGLVTISEKVAKALAGKKTGWIYLDGVRTLTGEAAGNLAAYEGSLSLRGLKVLSESAASGLASHKGAWLCLGDYVEVCDSSDPERIASVRRLLTRRGNLVLDGVKYLDTLCAGLLAQHGGSLALRKLKAIRDKEEAALLAQHEGPLSLGGLSCITEDAAEAFSNHPWALNLDGVSSLSVECAKLLASRSAPTSLKGLKSAPEDVLNILRTNPGVSAPGIVASGAGSENDYRTEHGKPVRSAQQSPPGKPTRNYSF